MVSRCELKRVAIKLLRNNIGFKRGEKIVLITDRRNDPIYSALYEASIELGGIVCEQRIRTGRQHSSPIPEARASLLWADIVLAITDASITHSAEIVEAAKRGLRGASMPEIWPELFVKALSGNAGKVDSANKKIMNALKGARKVRITSPAGSNFTLSIKGRRIVDNGPDLSNKGSVTNIPFGEVYLAPLETQGGGQIVFDNWKNIKGSILLKRGRITGWDSQGKKYVDYLRKAGQCGLVIAELGFGTNAAHRKPMGNILHDEKICGSVHVAFGQNVSFGGKNRCSVHEDAVILKPTVWIDSKKVIEQGKII